MPPTPFLRLKALMITLLLMAGCSDSTDQRYADLAEQALSNQAAQNQRLAEQSEQIVEASRNLVEHDAAARGQLVDAHAQLQQQIEDQRIGIDQQRVSLHQERRELAAQRGRDPIIAQAIHVTGLTLACLLPLLLAGYVLYSVNRSEASVDGLNELLISEIASDEPRLLQLNRTQPARLDQRPAEPKRIGPASDSDDEPPF